MSGVQQIATAITALKRVDAAALPEAALCEEIVELRQQIDRLEAVWCERVAVAHERGAATARGHVTTAAFLRQMCHLSPSAARARVSVATAVEQRLAVKEVFTEGAISFAHAAVLTTTLDDLPAEITADAEPVLVDAAVSLDPKRLAQAGRRLRHIADPDGAADRDARHCERRWLDVSTTLDGMVALTGLLDAESGAVLRTWLDAATPPPAAADERTAAQRRADALVELARAALDSGQLPDAGSERPHVAVMVDLTTLQGQSRTPAELAWAGPIGAAAARRLSCDAGVSRVVVAGGKRAAAGAVPPEYWAALPPPLRGPTQPLDVGRATRSVPPAIRRALVARDDGCAFPGCDRPPPWCDAHHIRHWAEGGATALPNLVLLCRRHHSTVHEHGWRITVRENGFVEFTPRAAQPAWG